LLFNLYMSELGRILAEHGEVSGVKFHIYADDVLLYISCSLKDLLRISALLSETIALVQTWMRENFLLLNPEKTHLILLHSKRASLPSPLPELNVCGKFVCFSTSGTIKWLGVKIDPHLDMDVFVQEKCRGCYGVLRMLRQVRASLTAYHTRLLCNALVISRLDYCSSLLASANKEAVTKLQRVVKLAARIISRRHRSDHISPVLRELKWPTAFEGRISMKLATLTYKSLRGCLPQYLQDEIKEYKPRRDLRSSSTTSTLLVLGSARTVCGRGAWGVAGPAVWNALPEDVREKNLKLSHFKNRLSNFVLNVEDEDR
jgi:hypothetical protein